MSDKPMTQEELAEIRDLAEKATPGHWEDVAACLECPREVGISRQDLAYIAAANPKTVLALLDEVKRLREEVARLDKESDWLATQLWNTGRVPLEANMAKIWREAARKAVEEKERYG